jgi:Rod binding domain-containing protein
MNLPPVSPPKVAPRQNDDPRITPEMREAAEGLEANFTAEMMKAMRGTVDESEFSLNNTGTQIYQGMLDQNYAEIAARGNSLGLSGQIIDYLLRSQPKEPYNKEGHTQPTVTRTGGTHEGKSGE